MFWPLAVLKFAGGAWSLIKLFENGICAGPVHPGKILSLRAWFSLDSFAHAFQASNGAQLWLYQDNTVTV